MAGAREIVFDILAIDRASKILEHVGEKAKGLGEHFGVVGKMAGGVLKAGAMGAALGITAAAGALVEGVKAGIDYQTLGLKTAAVLKSTGDASRQSVAGIQARAAALESMSGVDETTIINGQNVLATFTRVRDGVGKGNDIFNQATTAALNMSVALGTDLQGANIQLGKALNDPIKGITALQRVGVSFTEGQKKQIAEMVKSGNVMGAQKVILKELNTEFGGAAKAAGSGLGGSMARLKDTFDDFMRSVGLALLPYLQKLANWAANQLPKALAWLGQEWKRLQGPIAEVGHWVQVVWGFFANQLWPALQQGYKMILPALRLVLANVRSAFHDVTSTGIDFKALAAALWPVLKVVGAVILGVVVAALIGLSVQIRIAAAGFRYVLVPAIKFLAQMFFTQFGLIVDAAAWAFGWIPGLGPKLRAGQKQFHDFANSVMNALNGIPSHKSIDFTISVNGRQANVTQIGNAFNIKSGGHTVRALAEGGIVQARPGGTLALLGEGGHDEAVIPLGTGGTHWSGRKSGGDLYLTVNVSHPLASGRDIAQAVTNAFASSRASGAMTHAAMKAALA